MVCCIATLIKFLIEAARKLIHKERDKASPQSSAPESVLMQL